MEIDILRHATSKNIRRWQKDCTIMTISRAVYTSAAVFGMVVAAMTASLQPATAQDRAYAVEPVAVTGEPAPGTGGLSFGWIARGDISDSGIVAFIGAPDLTTENHAIWVGTPGNLNLAVSSGDPAPERIAEEFYQFGPLLVNANGDIWFGATLRYAGSITPGGVVGGFWAGTPGSLTSVAAPGDIAPGTQGLTFQDFAFAGNYTDSGGSAFGANVASTSGSLPGLWVGSSGSLELLALSGNPAPGTADLLYTGFADPIVNNTGTEGFLASTVDPSLEYGDGIWLAGSTGVELLARSGELAPGTGGRSFVSLVYGSLWGTAGYGGDLTASDTAGPVLNPVGDVAFNGFLAPYDPVTGIADEGIWLKDSIGLRLVTLIGDSAPGTSGLTFRDFNHINLNALGQLAFDAALDSGDQANDRGIWLGTPDNLGLLIREGDPAPGASGEAFANLVMGPSLNVLGEVAFYARLNESNSKGVWAGTAGDLSLIAREGEALWVRAGDYRTISSITPFEGAPSAHVGSRHFNEAGQLIFQVHFTDGTYGIFLASPVSTATNQPPVADAGPDRTVIENKSITIDGGASFDPENTVLTFVWSLDGVEVATGPQYTAGPFGVGTHTVTLTVTDREGASASDDMILTVDPNLPPVANAGPDQTVNFVQPVSLDGSGSSDPEGLALSYVWALDGAQIATGPNPIVGPFPVGARMITLTVTDDQGLSASDSMVVNVINEAPVARAGSDQWIQTLETVLLYGSASFDPEGETLSFVWSLDGAQIATGPTPVVGPFAAGTHTITLTVTDGHGASASDDVVLLVQNRAPTADAGPDRTVNHAQTVMLDASGSADPEGGSLSYAWSVDGLQVATGISATVGPFEVGTHSVVLTVTDDHGATATDNMTLTVINEAPVADAGPDQTVGVKGRTTTVALDGSSSADPEGGPLSYVWTLDGQIVGSGQVAQADVPAGTHVFTLTVTDDHGATNSDTMVVTAVKGNV
jgi:hypothetical protein